MNFGQALEHLKAGKALSRRFWTFEQSIFYVKTNNGSSYILMNTLNNTERWNPTLEDILAEDWRIIGNDRK